jgi:hypothetical protein
VDRPYGERHGVTARGDRPAQVGAARALRPTTDGWAVR